MQIHSTAAAFPQAGTPTVVRRDAVTAALLAACLGVMLVFGVGFLHSQAAHDVAHDTRHAMGFPCH